jgi:coatomer subunit gamma
VRASAVSALAKFAARCEDLRPQILPLLRRCTDDDDDEVRDRAAMFLRLLGDSVIAAEAAAPPSAVEAGISRGLTSGLLPLPVTSLSKALHL